MNDMEMSSQGETGLLHNLIGTRHWIDNRLDDALGAYGLSISKLAVLRHLVETAEPMPLGKLAGRLDCVKSNVTQLIDRLEQDGLVRRTADPEDRRSTRATITEEGRRRCELGIGVELAVEKELFESFSSVEQTQLAFLLSKFYCQRKS
jgi:DNA-binding MarR family transcriptional regulator